MKKKIRFFLTAGFFFTCVLGTLLHFTYEFTGHNPVVGLFSPISESTWEHLKMLFFPALVWCIPGGLLLYRTDRNLIWACTGGICAGLFTIVSVFYTYSGILGTNRLPLDILTFYLGVFAVFYPAYRYLKKNRPARKWHIYVSALILFLLTFCFIFFTRWQPPIGLFAEP